MDTNINSIHICRHIYIYLQCDPAFPLYRRILPVSQSVQADGGAGWARRPRLQRGESTHHARQGQSQGRWFVTNLHIVKALRLVCFHCCLQSWQVHKNRQFNYVDIKLKMQCKRKIYNLELNIAIAEIKNVLYLIPTILNNFQMNVL